MGKHLRPFWENRNRCRINTHIINQYWKEQQEHRQKIWLKNPRTITVGNCMRHVTSMELQHPLLWEGGIGGRCGKGKGQTVKCCPPISQLHYSAVQSSAGHGGNRLLSVGMGQQSGLVRGSSALKPHLSGKWHHWREHSWLSEENKSWTPPPTYVPSLAIQSGENKLPVQEGLLIPKDRCWL